MRAPTDPPAKSTGTPLDLNCDLGEGEPPARTRALLRRVTSANIACGVHAGGWQTMRNCARWAAELGVQVGAHPGLPAARGRGDAALTVSSFESLVGSQVAWMQAAAGSVQASLAHVKLHGSLYHEADRDDALGRALAKLMSGWFPGVRLYARAGGRAAYWAKRGGVPVWGEAFADRGYRADGALAPRGEPGALIADASLVKSRTLALALGEGLIAMDGTRLRICAQTLCIHSDTPNALRLAEVAQAALAEAARRANVALQT